MLTHHPSPLSNPVNPMIDVMVQRYEKKMYYFHICLQNYEKKSNFAKI